MQTSRRSLLGLFLLAQILSSIALSSPLDLDCNGQYTTQTYNEFSSRYLGTGFAELPVYLKSWVENSVDKNSNKAIEPNELQDASCRMSQVIKHVVAEKSTEYVSQRGRVQSLEYWAHDEKISSYNEFQLSLGSIAKIWLLEFVKNNLTGSLRTDSEQMIRSGAYTVSAKGLSGQWDLAAVDHSPHAQLLKSLELAHSVSELIAKTPSENLEIVLPAIMTQFVALKNFPRLISIEPIHSNNTFLKLRLEINNHMFGGGLGPKGANRYYIVEGTYLVIDIKDNGEYNVSWGQPRDQTWTVLRDPQYFTSDTSKFVNRVKVRLQELALNAKNSRNLFNSLKTEDLSTQQNLELWLTKISDTYSEVFWKEPVSITVTTDPLEGGDNAHVKDGKIYFSYSYIQSIYSDLSRSFSQEAALKQINRHLLFLITQEWVHTLQVAEPSYEENMGFYNNPAQAYLIFGSEGVKWYDQQPIEKDAKDLAENFVQNIFLPIK